MDQHFLFIHSMYYLETWILKKYLLLKLADCKTIALFIMCVDKLGPWLG